MSPNAISSVLDKDDNKNEKNVATGLGGIFRSFGPTERILFYLLASVMFFSGLIAASKANGLFLIEVPAHGGTFTEGISGSPRFINPLLSISDTDKSIATLVYAGLLTHEKNGNYVPLLAEYYSVSEDGLVYSVKIRDDAFFHDGRPVTAEDVQFTAEKALDPILKSPRRSNWEGVAVQVVDEKNIRFVLKKPYSPFLENLTIGILPKHVWKDATSEEFPFSQLNIEPIGAGPYKISDVKYNSSRVPILITLKSFGKYVAGEPFISKVEIRFFPSENDMVSAYESGDIDAVAGLSPQTAKRLSEKGLSVSSFLMPRVFGAFFNQNQSNVLLNKDVRQALDQSIDKKKLVDEVLLGFGIPLKGPVPSPISEWRAGTSTVGTSTESEIRLEKARSDLEKAGWKLNNDGILEKKIKGTTQILKFSISTSDAPELKMTADIIAGIWTKLGGAVDVKVFEPGDLNQNVIKPRRFDVLLFGEVIGRDMDLYPFWHSSQRIDPGLNIAQYANITADKLLDEIRLSTDKTIVEDRIMKFSLEVEKDVPTVFTYAPKFIYAISPLIKNVELQSISSQSERFANIQSWYIETDKVWSIFVK